MSIAGKISDALNTKLAALTLSPVLPIIYEGVNGAPPTNRTGFLQTQKLSTEVEAITVGGTSRWLETRGTWQVIVMYPEISGAVVAAEKIADLIAAHFKIGTTMTTGSINLQVLKAPRVVPAIIEGGWVQIPVQIRYTAQHTD